MDENKDFQNDGDLFLSDEGRNACARILLKIEDEFELDDGEMILLGIFLLTYKPGIKDMTPRLKNLYFTGWEYFHKNR